ncbi:MAG: hypothetical protein R3321_14310, partial [Nitrososphaeraceae archaeon]|nr:hypothetical protein [Nitrososphaeraceae archaeon]
GVEVSKKGHYSWYKEVDVPAGLVAAFQNIVMVPHDLTPTTLLPTVRNLFVSDNGEFVFYRDLSNNYGVVDLDNPVIKPSDEKLTTSLNIFSWDEDNENIFFSNYATSKIIGKSERIVPTPANLLNQTLTLVDEFIVSLSGNQIFVYDHEEGVFVDTINNASSFAVNGGRNVYYISTDDNLLYKYDLNNNENTLVSGVDNFSGGRILRAEVINNELYVLIRGGSNNFLFKVSTEEIELIASYIIDFSISHNGEKIAYWNNAEVWIYHLEDTNIQPFQEAGEFKRIFTGNSIVNVDWHKYNNGLIVFTNRAVIFTETDTRFNTNAITLFDALKDGDGPIQAIRNGVYNRGSDSIYFQTGTE